MSLLPCRTCGEIVIDPAIPQLDCPSCGAPVTSLEPPEVEPPGDDAGNGALEDIPKLCRCSSPDPMATGRCGKCGDRITPEASAPGAVRLAVGDVESTVPVPCVVGRTSLSIPDPLRNRLANGFPGVSGMHLLITVEQGQVSIMDLGARNGTFVEGPTGWERIRAHVVQPLHAPGKVRLGLQCHLTISAGGRGGAR